MSLNHDVLGLITDYINDPSTLYSLILTSKLFRRRLEKRFQKHFEPSRVSNENHVKLIKPLIYHPIRQSTINACERNGGHLIISQSGEYMFMENLIFAFDNRIGIELKSLNMEPVNVWIAGNSKTLTSTEPNINCMSENVNLFTFIKFRDEDNYVAHITNLTIETYELNSPIDWWNILDMTIENMYIHHIIL